VHILLKIENGRSMARARELLRQELDEVSREPQYKHVSVAIDVDIQ
jgi:hypothetical protein